MSKNKKAPDLSDAFLVEDITFSTHPCIEELKRWKYILDDDFARYKTYLRQVT